MHVKHFEEKSLKSEDSQKNSYPCITFFFITF